MRLILRWMAYGSCLVALTTLQGCFNAAVSSAQAVYNRHSLQKNINDQYITMQASRALYIESKQFENTHIDITTFNQKVLLVGQVPSAWQRTLAEEKVKEIPDVERVYNMLTIANPSSSLTRMSDVWITTKVKSKLIASEEIDPGSVKVLTEDGTVYLLGVLPPEQAEAAVDLARETEGVQKVVKIFFYLRVSEK